MTQCELQRDSECVCEKERGREYAPKREKKRQRMRYRVFALKTEKNSDLSEKKIEKKIRQ